MNLTAREKDKMLNSMGAMVARRRLARGIKLSFPLAVAPISDSCWKEREMVARSRT
jgi:urease gamma subunit